jgi:hypothetical protein
MMERLADSIAAWIFLNVLPNWLCADGWRGRVYLWFVARAGRWAYRDWQPGERP